LFAVVQCLYVGIDLMGMTVVRYYEYYWVDVCIWFVGGVGLGVCIELSECMMWSVDVDGLFE